MARAQRMLAATKKCDNQIEKTRCTARPKEGICPKQDSKQAQRHAMHRLLAFYNDVKFHPIKFNMGVGHTKIKACNILVV
eukprot:15315017-Ditylum_brightwellii.AAC.1